MNEQEYARLIARNLKRIAYENKKSQADISRDLKISKATVSSWMNGSRVPRMGKIDMLCHYFNCKRSDIMQEYVNSPQSVPAVRIPVLGRVAAGIPMDAIEEIIDYEEISEAVAKNGEYFGLLIKGDSMEPKISNGDVVIVRKQETADDGDIVIALINGQEGCCKRLKKYDNGIALISTNPAYDPMYFSNAEVIDKPVKIIGKVKELRSKF